MSSLSTIVVLKGGVSEEREVSLKTGAAVARALREAGKTVREVDLQSKELPEISSEKEEVFIALHGTYGEDGELQKILETRGLIFTGSSSEGCRNAFDKLETKRLLSEAGIPVPRGGAWDETLAWEKPYVIKPVAQGSSIGVYLVSTDEDEAHAKSSIEPGVPMLIEDMVVGDEFTVGLLGEKALPVIKICPREGFYDYAHKYTAGATDYLCPAPISHELSERLQDLAKKTMKALGCEVYGRVDIMMDAEGNLSVLELNTIPGMTELSLLPRAAQEAGYSFPELCGRILELSRERTK